MRMKLKRKYQMNRKRNQRCNREAHCKWNGIQLFWCENKTIKKKLNLLSKV